jgi:hypothetical protein
VGKPRDESGPATSLTDHVVLITGASGAKGGAVIASIAQHPGWARSVHHARVPQPIERKNALPPNPLAAT